MSNKDYYQGQQQSGYYPPPQGKFGHSFLPFPYLSSPIRSATRTGGLLPSAAAAIIPRSAIRWAPVRSGRLSTATPTQHGLCVSSDHKEQNPCASTNCATTLDRQQPPQQKGGGGGGCMACLAGVALCCCAEGA